MNRRSFFRDTALLSLTTLSTTAFSSTWLKSHFSVEKLMRRRNLTPYFIVEDALRLIQYSDFDQKLIDALEVNRSFVHLGAANNLPADDRRKMIQDSLNKWSEDDTLDEGQTQTSYLIGSILYPIIDNHLPYELPSHQVGQPILPLSDEAICFDVHLIQALFNAEPSNTNSDLKNALASVEKAELSELFHLIRQRNLIRTHTFRPEFSDVESWLENFLQYHHIIEDENQRYADLYLDPGKSNIRTSWQKFYNASDDLIELARDTQVGISESTIELDAASETMREQSTYAQILASCLTEIKEWNRCILGKTSEADLMARYQ